MITLINCKEKLISLGIDMDKLNSGELLGEKLSQKMNVISWEYNFADDKLIINVEGNVPDLSVFGEVVVNDGING